MENKIDVNQLLDEDVYAIILIKDESGKITFDLLREELIVGAFRRLISDKPNCEVRLLMRELHPKYFVHPNIEKVY